MTWNIVCNFMKCDLQSVPPSIVGVTNAIVQEGQSAVLSCQSNGDPVPDMTFYRQQPQQQQILGSYILNSNTSVSYKFNQMCITMQSTKVYEV
jgi:hypothetical protein